MDQETLTFLQWALVIVDGAGIYASLDRMIYYRTGRKDRGVYPIYVFFIVLFCVFLARSFSDLCVINNWPFWWAKLPIIRGHAFFTPIAVTILWMVHYQHNDHR